jgi:hypothetical protein
MAPVERVALLALVYKTMYRDCYEGSESLEDDLEAYPDGVSLIGMIGSQMLRSEDWELLGGINFAGDVPVALFRDLAAVDPLRAEAVFHAWRRDPQRELSDEEWGGPYIRRWALVEAMMASLAPVTWTREAQDDIARALG